MQVGKKSANETDAKLKLTWNLSPNTNMARLLAVALSHRDHFSHGNSRRIFGYEAYHWGVIVMSEASQGLACDVFDATDTSEINLATFRLTNPTMDWWYRVQERIDPTFNSKLVGRIVVGKVPDEISGAEIRQLFARVPLPAKNTAPQEGCVTWTVNAIGALQSRGWVPDFDIDVFKDWALAYADERMRGLDSREPSVVHYDPGN